MFSEAMSLRKFGNWVQNRLRRVRHQSSPEDTLPLVSNEQEVAEDQPSSPVVSRPYPTPLNPFEGGDEGEPAAAAAQPSPSEPVIQWPSDSEEPDLIIGYKGTLSTPRDQKNGYPTLVFTVDGKDIILI